MLSSATVNLPPFEAAPATLYVVATPIGNRADLSLRALSVLQSVNAIAAEDTRHTAGLLHYFGLQTRLFPLHEHNEASQAQKIIQQLQQGDSLALVSDAGTPAISDPGAKLVAAVRAAGLTVVPIPGACAAVTALSASGLLAPHWLFYGFLPAKTQARQNILQTFAEAEHAVIFYEAPHRLHECLQDFSHCFTPAREITIARELTKTFENITTLSLAEVDDWLAADPYHSRGEFVLLLHPAASRAADTIPATAWHMLTRLAEELPLKTAAKLTAEFTGIRKNLLYEAALTQRDKR